MKKMKKLWILIFVIFLLTACESAQLPKNSEKGKSTYSNESSFPYKTDTGIIYFEK
jgi:PBP1b-binding outer membrane lipoprotein LpoB